MLIVPEVKEAEPNEGQAAALDAFLEFLLDDDETEFRLAGPAGTGKTFTMRKAATEMLTRYHELCKMLNKPIRYNEVVMTATTNKAAEVLSKAIGMSARTIHSYLQYTVKANFDTGRTSLVRSRDWTMKTNTIIFIDECSMIDRALDKAIRDSTQNCKIVYVGDPSQLSPVGEKLSQIYLRESPTVALTQQMRNNTQPALMALCAQLRKTVDTGIFQPIDIVPGVVDHLDDEAMQEMLINEMMDLHHNSKVVAYTNDKVIGYNDYLREMRNLPEEYQAGETLVCNSPFSGSVMVPAEMEVTVVANHGHEYVTLGGDTQMAINRIDLEWGDVLLRNVPYPTNWDHYKRLLKFYAGEKDWPTYYTLKEKYIDLRPRDAGTIHKAQGSTYDSIFIDLDTISKCNIVNDVARMLYVAVSRPRSRIFLHGKLASKYGGLRFP